jgi:hypothetical protein
MKHSLRCEEYIKIYLKEMGKWDIIVIELAKIQVNGGL